jgi:uncharacterized membrane protein
MKKIFIFILLALTFLAGCTESTPGKNAENASARESVATSNFRGEKGQFVTMKNSLVTIDAASVSDGKVHYFNTTLKSGDPVYFFIAKSPDGKLRAAANGCQVCGGALQGFRQEGDFMVCNTCGNRYPLNKIATEKGGCNPAPISPDLAVNDGKITLSEPELEAITQYFN